MSPLRFYYLHSFEKNYPEVWLQRGGEKKYLVMETRIKVKR